MLKLTCAGIALLAFANPALAGCATPLEASALKTAVVQQELMVAALQCHEAAAYNQFVLGYRGELQASDAALKAYFIKRGGEHGEAGYDTFKTKAANLSGLEQARDSRAFCADAHALFSAAAQNNGSLTQFVENRTAPLDVGALCKEARPVLASVEPAKPAARPVVVAAAIASPPRVVRVAEVHKIDNDVAANVVGGVPEHARPDNVWRREERAAPPPDMQDDRDDVRPATADADDLTPPARLYQIRQRSDDPPVDWHERARQAWAEQDAQATPRDRWVPRDGW